MNACARSARAPCVRSCRCRSSGRSSSGARRATSGRSARAGRAGRSLGARSGSRRGRAPSRCRRSTCRVRGGTGRRRRCRRSGRRWRGGGTRASCRVRRRWRGRGGCRGSGCAGGRSSGISRSSLPESPLPRGITMGSGFCSPTFAPRVSSKVVLEIRTSRAKSGYVASYFLATINAT